MNKITFSNSSELEVFYANNCDRCTHVGKCLNQRYLIAGLPEELPDHVLYQASDVVLCLLFVKIKKTQTEKYKRLRGS